MCNQNVKLHKMYTKMIVHISTDQLTQVYISQVSIQPSFKNMKKLLCKTFVFHKLLNKTDQAVKK